MVSQRPVTRQEVRPHSVLGEQGTSWEGARLQGGGQEAPPRALRW